MGYELVGKVWDSESFRRYLNDVSLRWADSVTVHHTASPNLAQRPSGWTIQHMRNIQHFYQTVLRWSAGPHLFTDEDQIFGMSSLWRRGVHARSFNSHSIGIEMLGDYDRENPEAGRGLSVINTTAEVVAIILKKMNLEPNNDTVLFHRDDPRTSKTCPGTRVDKEWFLDKVRKHFDIPPEDLPTEALTLEQRVARLEAHIGI